MSEEMDTDLKSVKEKIHVCECEVCGRTFETQWKICPSCGSHDMKYGMMKVKHYTPLQKRQKMLITEARIREEALDYDAAIEMWESLGNIKQAARIRKLKTMQKSVKVAQKVVKGNEVTKTEIKDSVLNRSNVGGGSSKMQELKDLTEMKKEGLIDAAEFKQMKKEILSK